MDAVHSGDVCLMEVTRTGSKKKAYVACSAAEGDDAEMLIVPLAEIPDRDPIDMFKPPGGQVKGG